MPGIREKLNAFLDKSARRRFEWGVCDCMLEVADWLDRACGTDIANEWRGTYSTEEEAYARLGGDLVTAMRAEAARRGLTEAAEPQFGDIGIVLPPGQDKPLGAILMPSGRWRMLTQAGIALTADVTVLVAWALPCRPKPSARS